MCQTPVTTIIGIIAGFALIVFGIKLPNIGNFIDIDSILIVVGGTFAAIIANHPLRLLMAMPKHFLVTMKEKKYNIPKLVDQLCDLAMTARQNGLLALEEQAEELDEPFLKQGVMLLVDATDADKIRHMLELEMDSLADRHDEAASMYEMASSAAPAFGMIGTLVGLINMLKGLNLDGSGGASTLGEDMSVALITTFYGCMLANLVFNPIAKKLRIRHQEQELYCTLVIEGVLAIQVGENPKFLREHLLATLTESQQKKLMLKTEDPKGKEVEEA